MDDPQAGLVALTTLTSVRLNFGFGIHQWNVPLSKVFEFYKVSYTSLPYRLGIHSQRFWLVFKCRRDYLLSNHFLHEISDSYADPACVSHQP